MRYVFGYPPLSASPEVANNLKSRIQTEFCNFKSYFLIYFSATKSSKLTSSSCNATNPGYITASCPVSPKNYAFGWHFVLPDVSQSFITISCTFSKAGVITDMIQQPCNMHAYVYTPTGDTLISASANITGTSDTFVLSDVCTPPGRCNSAWWRVHKLILSFYPKYEASVGRC